MKVIYVGFSKTGTKTMASAFRILGFKCYDSLEYYSYQKDEWKMIFLKGGSKEDFKKMLEDVDATTDVPGCFYWEQILEAFPNLKIVYGERSSEDEWWKSMKKQVESNDNLIWKLISSLSPTSYSFDNWFFHLIRSVFHLDFYKPLLGKVRYNETLLRKSYRRHNSYVIKKAPKDQLLKFQFDQGWGPLCQFLDLPVPQTPFPHKNKNASVIEDLMATNPTVIRMKYEMMTSACLLVCFCGFGIYKIFF